MLKLFLSESSHDSALFKNAIFRIVPLGGCEENVGFELFESASGSGSSRQESSTPLHQTLLVHPVLIGPTRYGCCVLANSADDVMTLSVPARLAGGKGASLDRNKKIVMRASNISTRHLRLKENELNHFYRDLQLNCFHANISGRLITINGWVFIGPTRMLHFFKQCR